MMYLVTVAGTEIPTRTALQEVMRESPDEVAVTGIDDEGKPKRKLMLSEVDGLEAYETLAVTNSKRSFFARLGRRPDKTWYMEPQKR